MNLLNIMGLISIKKLMFASLKKALQIWGVLFYLPFFLALYLYLGGESIELLHYYSDEYDPYHDDYGNQACCFFIRLLLRSFTSRNQHDYC